jgi:Raf kinase inhibitor-like YbhB/YbcL family protein
MIRGLSAFVLVAFFAVPAAAQTPEIITVESPTIRANQMIPRDHTADGKNVSPALIWSNVPPTARSFAVVCIDPDAGAAPGFVHWVVYNISDAANGIPEGAPIDPAAPMPPQMAGATQGMSGFRRPIYRGPAPPPGKPHHYHFIVYALDLPAGSLAPGLNHAGLQDAMKGHIVGKGELVAIYERKPPQ